MAKSIQIREKACKTAIGKCGFPGGGLAINPYIGCGHDCVYCYARFIKRFTGHKEKWGKFVDAKINVADVLKKQLALLKYNTDQKEQIYIGTVTDPYQPVEKKYALTRKLLQVLIDRENPVSILTKSDLVIRDIDLLKKMKKIDVNFTVATLDEKWKKVTEPNSSTIKQRLTAMKTLNEEKINVFAMIGPYWPIFTDPEALFKEFKKAGVKRVFSESFNTVGGNWTGVEDVIAKYYPKILPEIKTILFDKNNFYNFYNQAEIKINQASKKYKIPATIYFGLGHAAKFKQN